MKVQGLQCSSQLDLLLSMFRDDCSHARSRGIETAMRAAQLGQNKRRNRLKDPTMINNLPFLNILRPFLQSYTRI